MKRWMKILSAVVVVVVGLLVAGVAVLANMDFNQYKGLVAEQVKSATGRDLQIAGDLNLAISLTPAIEVNGVTFANADWGSRPEMATVEYFAAEVALLPLLTQQIEISRLVLRNVDVLAETDASGRGNWEFEAATAAEPEPEPEADAGGAATLPSVDRVTMENVSLTYRDGVTGETQRVRIDSLTAQAPTLQEPVAFELVARLNDEALEAAGTLGSVDQMSSPDTVYPVSIKASLLAAEIGFEGRLGTPDGILTMNGTANVRGDSLVETMERAGNAVPALKGVGVPDAGAYEASVGLDMQGNTVKLSGLAAKLGDSDVNGDATVNLGGGRPSVDASLTSSLVDLTQLLPEAAAQGGAAAPADGGGDGRVFPDDPLPLDGLKAADVALTYQAGKIIAPQDLTVTEVALAMTLKGGRLEVSKLEASSYQGKLAARALVDAAKATPQVGLAAKLDGLDFGALLKARGMTDVATGTLDADVEVAGNGGSVRSIMAGLGGHTRFVVPGGKLDSNVLNIATGDIAAALPFLDSTDDKTIRCGVVDFRITDGIAAAKALVFETGGISAVGVGDANLKDETLNLAVDPRAKKQSLASMALTPIKIGGTFAAPSVSPDPAALAGTVAGTAARAAGAVATMGLSLLAERAVGEVTGSGIDTTDYCTPALAGKQVVPGGTADQSSSSGGEPPATQDSGGSGNPVEELGKGLQNLFGN